MAVPSNGFSIARLPRIEFGAGSIGKLPELAARYGRTALVVTGSRSVVDTPQWQQLVSGLNDLGIDMVHAGRSGGEPTPEEIDQKVAEFADRPIDVVIGIGGGSVLDAAKAIAGLLQVKASVMDFLEGVGPERPYPGPATPFIAVPATAGTGSEATKNAVLSRHGEGGFKKSFRDEQLVPDWAVVDPDLIATCPREVLAGNGMDAFTQLLESYVSTRANPFTDALALDGMTCVRDGLLNLVASDGGDADARALMARAALFSGINLAQTGLGSVHGLASPLGAFFPIPHGIVCGTLVAAATRVNIKALTVRSDPAGPALDKYARAGRLLSGIDRLSRDEALTALIDIVDNWTEKLVLPRLGSYAVTERDFERIVANSRGSSMKTNPIELQDSEIAEILRQRL